MLCVSQRWQAQGAYIAARALLALTQLSLSGAWLLSRTFGRPIPSCFLFCHFFVFFTMLSHGLLSLLALSAVSTASPISQVRRSSLIPTPPPACLGKISNSTAASNTTITLHPFRTSRLASIPPPRRLV
ncbi:hypothetical protein EDB87DRAFT_717707 [Lactarius vividus]|nr:hypothetical protein EDB87DRAFT_717707 [Lactarius vividus]